MIAWFSNAARRVTVCFVAALLFSVSANAHEVATSHLLIASESDAPFRAEIDLAVRDLALQRPIDADADGAVRWRDILAESPAIQQLATRAIRVKTGSSECVLAPGDLRLRRYADGAYVSVPLVAKDCLRDVVAEVALGDWLATDRSHRMLVTFDGSDAAPAVLAANGDAVRLDRSGSNAFGTFFVEGIRHILAGYDHLAFVLSLLLPVVVVGTRARSTRDALGRAALVVTAFTIAHSVTLTLAALGLVWPAPSFVEPAIAASIALAALNNVFRVVDRHLAWLAAGFGLIHGFGFAGALTELGLPVASRVSSLLAFNLGVECGQLAVVAVALPILSLAARWRLYARWVMAPASLAIAALGGFWFVTRIA